MDISRKHISHLRLREKCGRGSRAIVNQTICEFAVSLRSLIISEVAPI